MKTAPDSGLRTYGTGIIVRGTATMVVAAALAVAMPVNCKSCIHAHGSRGVSQESALVTSVQNVLTVNGARLTPGETAARGFTPQANSPEAPGTATVTYWPPPGVTNIQFTGQQPTNPSGPPPYVFENVPVAASGVPPAQPTIEVSFQAGENDHSQQVQETWATSGADGEVLAREAIVVDLLPGGFPEESATPPRLAGEGIAAQRLDDPYMVWRAEVFSAPDVTLDPEVCGLIVDAASSGRFFFAVRVPDDLLQTGQPGTVHVPFVERDNKAPHVDLRDYTRFSAQQTVLSIPLEVDPARTNDVLEILPQGSGTLWTALVPAPGESLTCPADLDAPDGAWELFSQVYLDFGGAADACNGCIIDVYGCYEGTDDPFALFGTAQGPAAVGATGIHQGSGITCAGPFVVQLTTGAVAPIDLSGPGFATLDPPGQLRFQHRAYNRSTGSKTVSFVMQSSQGISWRLYLGDPSQDQQVTTPLAFAGNQSRTLWAVADVPAIGSPIDGGTTVVSGPEVLTLSATTVGNPDEVSMSSDIAWLGGWTPPAVDPALAVAEPEIGRRAPVVVSGVLPDGTYRVAVVPNGSFVAGACYTGEVVASVDVVVSNSTLPATTVWVCATPGSYDVLALSGPCVGSGDATVALSGGDAVIVTGDDLSANPGIEVSALSRHLRRFIKR